MQTPSTADTVNQFCTFHIGRRLFGVKVTDVKEIHSVVDFTPLFHATEDVKGLVNIRGQVHVVIDLGTLLGFGNKTIVDSNQIVLFKPHVGESFGVLVDCIGDVIETDPSFIETSGKTDRHMEDPHLKNFSDLIEGICKMEDQLLVILDSASLLRKIEEKHQLKRR